MSNDVKAIQQQPIKTDDELASATGKARLVAKTSELLGRPLPPPLEIATVENVHPLGETCHSMAAIRYGEYVAKISAEPLSPNVRAHASP